MMIKFCEQRAPTQIHREKFDIIDLTVIKMRNFDILQEKFVKQLLQRIYHDGQFSHSRIMGKNEHDLKRENMIFSSNHVFVIQATRREWLRARIYRGTKIIADFFLKNFMT